MTIPFEIHGMEYGNCNCAYGCPCQFNALPTHGDCQYLLFARVDSGFYGDTSLDGVVFAMFGKFPGAVHEGNGTQQLVIDESADDGQRAAIRTIIYNEEPYELKSHWAVYNAMSTSSLAPIITKIAFEADIEERTATGSAPGLFESKASPILNPVTGAEHRAQIVLPHGFEYTVAEMGSGTSTTQDPVPLHFADSYAQFNELHINQDGVIR
ncbi:MAG: DUF1326 domain-containing protein [Thermohalobaculum sp.]